jgi:glyoxylate/hydroxypyruvate reductase A
MALLFISDSDNPDWWRQELGARLPGLEMRVWPEIGDPRDIEVALVWRPPPGLLKSLPNLKLIASLGAGVDHLFADPDLPRNVPLCRLVDPNLTQRMSEYVALHVLRYHRRLPEIEAQQRATRWSDIYTPTASERGVGIMGLGELGAAAAAHLVGLGFRVAGWSRSEKRLAGVDGFIGEAGLGDFLAQSEILVCLLPLTPATENILSESLFARLPEGAALINAARGRHLVEADLLRALDEGRLSYATLDVFRTEPLPPEHPFWRHPRITVTPHNASATDARTAADLVAENIRRLEASEELLHRVNPLKGY